MESKPSNAPEHCPGTLSETAGKVSACQGCPNQAICASGATRGPDLGAEQVKARLSSVKNKLLILSGKGGVGKSTFTSLLARALAAQDSNRNVAVLDIDVCGPSMPRVMGLLGEEVHQSGSGWSPVFVEDNLCVMSIGFLLASPDDAVIWRGPKKNGMIRQFLSDVDWGESVDYMLLDTPPGTSDEHLSATTYLKGTDNISAIILTTPQEVALLDVRKEIDFCNKVNIPILGVVENMSAFVCPKCSTSSEIFPATTGGGKKMAAEHNVNFLGNLPLDPLLARCCDEGRDYLTEMPNSPTVQALHRIVERPYKINVSNRLIFWNSGHPDNVTSHTISALNAATAVTSENGSSFSSSSSLSSFVVKAFEAPSFIFTCTVGTTQVTILSSTDI